MRSFSTSFAIGLRAEYYSQQMNVSASQKTVIAPLNVGKSWTPDIGAPPANDRFCIEYVLAINPEWSNVFMSATYNGVPLSSATGTHLPAIVLRDTDL